jgi:hypothetical protein
VLLSRVTGIGATPNPEAIREIAVAISDRTLKDDAEPSA